MFDLPKVGSEFTRPVCRAAEAAIDRYLLWTPSPTSAANPPIAAAAIN